MKAEIFKSIIVKSNQNIDYKTITEIKASQTIKSVTIKAVVMPGGHLSLEGIIKIHSHLHAVQAFLKHSILLIGQNSSAVSIPTLEIESNDVQASHASTIGPLDPEQLFYLMSRGLNKSQAVKLIIKSFLSN